MREYNLNGNKISCFSHQAMATLFELHLIHEDKTYSAQVSEALFRELDFLEQELSRFIENSDISRINNLTEGETTIVGLHTFNCLRTAINMYYQTNGIFDIGAGDIISYWKNNPSLPAKDFSRNRGIEHLFLDDSELSVTLGGASVDIDLGGIGKGFALDHLKQILLEWNIKKALIQGGYSSALLLDGPDGMNGWPISISDPASDEEKVLEKIFLENISISSSGLRKGSHIIDPRTGRPAGNYSGIWVKSPFAVYSDILSTSFMLYTLDEIEKYHFENRNIGCLVIAKNGKVSKFGCW